MELSKFDSTEHSKTSKRIHMSKIIIVLLLSIAVFSFAQETRIEKISSGEANQKEGMFGWQVSHDKTFAFVSAPHEDSDVTNSGAVYVYRRSNAKLSFMQRIVIPGANSFSMFGILMAHSNTHLVIASVSTIDTSLGSGNLFLYKLVDQEWKLMDVISSDIADSSPTSLSMDKNIIAAGFGFVHGDYGNGYVQLYSINPATDKLSVQQTITVSGLEPFVVIGHDVEIQDDVLAFSSLGDRGNSELSGAVWIYKNRNGVWQQQSKIAHHDANPLDHFGYSISIDLPLVAVGAPRYMASAGKRTGAVFIFQLTDAGYFTESVLTSQGSGGVYDYFGSSIDVNDNAIAIGAHADDFAGTNTGAVYIFERKNSLWTAVNKLVGTNVSDHATFGGSISFYDGSLLASSHLEESDESFTDHGAVYYYNNPEIITSVAGEDIKKALSPVSVYPNPFSNSFKFSVKEGTQVESIYVTDLQGRMVEQLSFGKNSVSPLLVNTSRWSAGVYLIQVYTSTDHYSVTMLKL
jgi:hypothetical protein